MSRFYDAMRRAFSDEADTKPDLKIDRDSSDRTDPEIELEKIEAEVSRAKKTSERAISPPIPIRSGRFYDAIRRAFSEEAEDIPDRSPERLPSDRTDPEIELAQIEAEIARVKEPPPTVSVFPAPPRATQELEIEDQDIETEPIKAHYERIIQRLVAFRGGRRHCVVLVAGAAPGEGASTVSRELAVALAQSHNGRVILVDANLRRPSQQQAFRVESNVGLVDVLINGAKVSSALQVVPKTGLTLLCAGEVGDGARQLLTATSVQKVITALHAHYDWVILDGPAVTTNPDASSLAAVSDGAILVLRAEQTRWEVAEEAKKILDQTGVMVLGGVLNRRRYHIPEFLYSRL